MGKGFITGTLWGVLAAGFGLVAVSQIAPPPGAKAPVVTAPEAAEPVVAPERVVAEVQVPVVAEPEAAAVVAPPAVVAEVPVAPAPVVPEVTPTPAPVVAAVPEAAPVVASDAVPEVPADAVVAEKADDAKPSILKKPEPLPATPPLVAKREVPVAEPLAEADAAPTVASPGETAEVAVAETAPAVTSGPPGDLVAAVQPARGPDLPAPTLAPAAPVRPAAVASVGPPPAAPPTPLQPATTVVVTEPPPVMTPAVPVEGAVAPVVTARSGFQPGLLGDAPTPSAADAPPGIGLLPPPPPLTPEELAILAEGAATDAALPEVIVLTEADAPAAPSILKKPAPLAPVPSLTAKGQVPATEALPTVSAEPVDVPVVVPEAVALPDENAPPIERFARPFDIAAGKPLFVIVLIDTGDPQIDRAALAAMPFPVTFALDPSAPESALAASIYRGAGQEVVMLATGLPKGATAADVEVSFGAHEAALPEAVAVLDLEAGGFQGDRPLSTLVVPVLAGQGRGLLSWDRGLNAASQVARREGLRSGVIFRRLDGEGEPAPQIRRYLDRAAFKAAQDGRVIVAGETKPETVAALLEWAVEGRASTVALAPLTAALRVE